MAKPKPNIKCARCGYEWNTNSKTKRVTCPSCYYSTLNPQYEGVQK